MSRWATAHTPEPPSRSPGPGSPQPRTGLLNLSKEPKFFSMSVRRPLRSLAPFRSQDRPERGVEEVAAQIEGQLLRPLGDGGGRACPLGSSASFPGPRSLPSHRRHGACRGGASSSRRRSKAPAPRRRREGAAGMYSPSGLTEACSDCLTGPPSAAGRDCHVLPLLPGQGPRKRVSPGRQQLRFLRPSPSHMRNQLVHRLLLLVGKVGPLARIGHQDGRPGTGPGENPPAPAGGVFLHVDHFQPDPALTAYSDSVRLFPRHRRHDLSWKQWVETRREHDFWCAALFREAATLAYKS